MTRKNIANLALLAVIGLTWFCIGWIAREWSAAQRVQQDPEIALVEQVRQRLLFEHPNKPLTSRELTYAAIRGMLRHTEDLYAALLEPAVAQRFWDDFAGQSGVIGLSFKQKCGQILVKTVSPGAPADRAGLLPDDVILAIDGQEFDSATSGPEVSLSLRGPVGEPAHLTVKRGEEILEFYPVRQAREIVTFKMLEDEVAYVALSAFSSGAPQEMGQALRELLAQHPKGLIWDLRANGGGSMQATKEILSDFIADGLLFTAELKGGKQRPFMASGKGIATDVSLVVLIDEHTFSAGETAAATILERDRGVLVGTPTYGKSTINATYPLPEGCMLQMTIGKSLSPQGRWYQERGVPPDILLSDDPNTVEDEVLEFARDYVLQHKE